MNKMKHVRVGRYCMFDAPIVVWLTGDLDSTTRFQWTPHSRIEMFIGTPEVGYPSWSQVVQNATHEVMETAFILKRCHFKPNGSLINSACDSYLMMARHYEFTEICQNAGDMLTMLLPDLSAAYKTFRKKSRLS